ncbi:MAG TPA: DUF3768 domain-containing protein [Candidatus Acidoferrum sp.]|jgi:hypothetical protein|nr:DUF3768 domain-containing protein [Candidatus Acidoferrum sp.]
MDIDSPSKVARIRELNDNFRTTFAGGVVLLTHGVDTLCAEVKAEVLSRVRSFSHFSSENDPHGEHDFGSFDIGSHKFFWKLSYYDRATFDQPENFGSEDPSDPAKTTRVLTIMLAEEY